MKTSEERDLFPGALEVMILPTLERQPLHGYALAQHIKRTSNDLLQIEEGSHYPALQRLLKTEFVSAERGSPPRTAACGFTGSPKQVRNTCDLRFPPSRKCSKGLHGS